MKNLAILIGLILIKINTFAIDLQTALTQSYNNSDALQKLRNEFIQQTEKFPQALSSFLPDINANLKATNLKRKNSNDFSAISNTTDIWQKNIIITQNIFNGGSSLANLNAVQELFKALRGKYYADEQKNFLEAINSYLDCYEKQEIYKITEISFQNNHKQLEAAEAKLQAGEITKAELALTKANLSAAENNKLRAYAELQSAMANYTTVFGTQFDNVEIPELPQNLPNSLEDLLKKSSISNPSIEYAKYALSTNKAYEKATKGSLLPKVDFALSAEKQFSVPEEQSRNTKVFNISSTLGITIPIYSRGGVEYSNIRQSKLNTRNSVIDLDLAIKTNKANCISAFEFLQASKAQIIAATKAVEAAEIAYEGIVTEEQLGSKTIIDVLNAEDKLNSTRIEKIRAQKTAIISAYQIKSLIGELTAKSLKLKVNYFSPEEEFKKAKLKIIGF